jgi:hypothetical protein
MHPAKSVADNPPTISAIDRTSPLRVSSTTVPATATTSSHAQTGRRYQRGWSNATMNVSRYSASGSTHSKGTGAISCVIVLVVASSSAAAHAGSATHSTACTTRTAACGLALFSTFVLFGAKPRAACRATSTAHVPHNAANTTIPTDHTVACARRVISGSTASGYASRASSDPALDSAYILYTEASGRRRAYHAWSSGLVAASATHGRPTVTPSSSRIRQVGSDPAASAAGCHRADGTIAGSADAAAASSTRAWTADCARALSRLAPRWA